jgi:hypothetical protein
VLNYTSSLNLAVFGHESAHLDAVARTFAARVGQVISPEIDCAIFAINPNTGIDQHTIETWQAFDEFLVPRIVVVTDLEKDAGDFDDAVMLANRVFDQIATPYLVLHDDDGLPRALIGLRDMTIVDYSTMPPTFTASEPEHETLVQEFRDEYLELSTSMGNDAFSAGVLFPAIPLWIEKGLGVDVVISYLDQLNK